MALGKKKIGKAEGLVGPDFREKERPIEADGLDSKAQNEAI